MTDHEHCSPPNAPPAIHPERGTALADPRGAILPLLPKLHGYARSLTGGNEEAAGDLVQDTVVLALQAWATFTPGTNLKAWLFRILHNRHLTVRSRRHHRAEIGVEDLGLFGSVPAFQEDRAELRHFKAAFARLKPSHREALVLYAVHGLPYEEIAEVTGGNVGTVKSRMNRARTALKAMLLGDRSIGDRTVAPPPTRQRPRARPAPVAPAVPAPVTLAPTIPALPPPPPEPILVRPFPGLPAVRLPWIAEVERRIVQAELHVTRYRLIIERLGAVGVATDGVEATVRLAEERLGLLQAQRHRLLADHLETWPGA